MIAKLQVVKDLGNNLGIFADRRVDGNPSLKSDAKSGVDQSISGDELVNGRARAHVNISETFRYGPGVHVALVRYFQFESEQAKAFLHLRLDQIAMLIFSARVQPIKACFVDFQV